MGGLAIYLEHQMVIEETEHYVLYRAPYRGDFIKRKDVLSILEDIREQGFRPLHFELGSQAFVCEKIEFKMDVSPDAENIRSEG